MNQLLLLYPMCLMLVAEDETGEWEICCGAIHAYVALLAFIVFDISAVFITLAAYFWYSIDPVRFTQVVNSSHRSSSERGPSDVVNNCAVDRTYRFDPHLRHRTHRPIL